MTPISLDCRAGARFRRPEDCGRLYGNEVNIDAYVEHLVQLEAH